MKVIDLTTGRGHFVLNGEVPNDLQEKAAEVMDEAQFYKWPQDGRNFRLAMSFEDRTYCEDVIVELLDDLSPFIKSGDMTFSGFEDEFWRFRFDEEQRVFVEEIGSIVYTPVERRAV